MADGSIVVVGSINQDLIGTATRFPRAGETLLGGQFSTSPGGKGGNQAVAAARAGGRVVFLGAVGDDDFGVGLAASLTDAGVSIQGLRTVPGPSGIALITVTDAGENSIVVLPGANGRLTALTDGDAATISTAALLVLQLEIPSATVTAAARVAAAAGVPVLLNASPVAELPTDLIAATTIAVVNQGEAAELGAALDDVPHLVTTLGAAGSRYRGPDGSSVAMPGFSARPVDTTGAGDAFTGALAVAWTRGDRPRDALRWAGAAGALATLTAGAAGSSPTASDIETFLAGHPVEIAPAKR